MLTMGLKFLAALLLVGLPRGSESELLEYCQVEVELISFDFRVIENALEILHITATEETNCANDDGTLRYGYCETTVWSYLDCQVKLTVEFKKQSTIFCNNVTHGNESDMQLIMLHLNPSNGFDLGYIVSMEAVAPISQEPCVFKGTFFYMGHDIFTHGRCKAVFNICYLKAPHNLCVGKRIGGGHVSRTFPGKNLVDVKALFIFRNCTSYNYSGDSFSAVDCGGFFLFCFSPDDLHCHIGDDPKIVGFDHQHVTVNDPCMFNAVTFNLNDVCKFWIHVKVTNQTSGVAMLTYVSIGTRDNDIELDKDTLIVDGTVVEGTLGYFNDYYYDYFKRYQGFIEITLRCGVQIKWKARLGLLKIYAPPFFSTSVFGLCGNANCDRQDDLAIGSHEHLVADTSPNPSGMQQCDPSYYYST